jgi:hypothetical protein
MEDYCAAITAQGLRQLSILRSLTPGPDSQCPHPPAVLISGHFDLLLNGDCLSSRLSRSDSLIL